MERSKTADTDCWEGNELPSMPLFSFLDEPETDGNAVRLEEKPQKIETSGRITTSYRATKRTKASEPQGMLKTRKVEVKGAKHAATKTKEGTTQGTTKGGRAGHANRQKKRAILPFDFIKDTAAVHELEDINARIKHASSSSDSLDRNALQHVQLPLDLEEDLLPGLGSTFAGGFIRVRKKLEY